MAEAWEKYLLGILPDIESIRRPDERMTALLEESVWRVIAIAWLLGKYQVQERQEIEMRDEDYIPEVIELPHEEAIAYLKSRTSMSRDAFYNLEAAGRFRAFTVAKISGMDAIETTKEKLAVALSEGQSASEFIQSGRANKVLQKGGFSKSTPWYWETVYRTNAIAAWNGGRFQQYREVSDTIQDLQYISILDRRTSDVCRVYNGICRPVTDPIWQRITPPNHFNCRSTVRAIFRGTMEAKGTTRTTDEDVSTLPIPEDGFDSSIVVVKDFLTTPKVVMQKIMVQGSDEEIQNAKKSYRAMMNEGGEGYNPYAKESIAPPMDRADEMYKIQGFMNSMSSQDPKWEELKSKWEALFKQEWDIETTKARRALWNAWVTAEKAAGRKIPQELMRTKEKTLGFTFSNLKQAIGLHGL